MLSPLRVALVLAALLLVTSACAAKNRPSDSTTPPEIGACRTLAPADLTRSTNDTPTVPCRDGHTAETFFVGEFTGAADTDQPEDTKLGIQAHDLCQPAFIEFLGGDESLVMRSTLTWAWYRPSDKAWKKGARWLRCDVVGGGEQSKQFVDLPETTKGVLLGRPSDQWLVCAQGDTVDGAVKVPCTQQHDWRAISTVVLGRADDPYPGDRAVELKTRDYCSDQVGAYLGYPVTDYDFGFTWFHEGEWKAGNRRSICWAKTSK
ncbi:MAG: septum formation family protein [Nocardioidaceae bacterium]